LTEAATKKPSQHSQPSQHARDNTAASDPATRDAVARGSGRTVSTRMPSSIDVYKEDFERQSPAPDWLQLLRRQGITRFEALGYPTTKNEDWHFTSVAPIAERTFRLATLESLEGAARDSA